MKEQTATVTRKIVRGVEGCAKDGIFVIGDSHSIFWSGLAECKPFKHGIDVPLEQNNFFRVFHLGPCLAYSMNQYGTLTLGREKVEYLLSHEHITKNSTIMCAFGEIDLRVHILKGGEKEMRPRLLKSLNNYLEFLEFLHSEKHDVICYGPIASQKDDWRMNERYPRAGSEYERNNATLLYNTLLADQCKKRNMNFITLFHDMVDSELRTNEAYIGDECHLSPSVYEFARQKFFKELDPFSGLG
jgi:hypothetical protein